MPFVKPFPEGEYVANIFISELSENLEGYPEMDKQTLELAFKEPGFIGYESVRTSDKGIFISYWETMADVERWRKNEIHLVAKASGRVWYKSFVSQMVTVRSTSIHPR